MNPDLKIAQSITPKNIDLIAQSINIDINVLEHYGKYKAKLPINLIDENNIKSCNLILVTAITPTPAGEGKSTTTVGLADGLNRIGKKTIAVLREPSLGPVFGMKEGGRPVVAIHKSFQWKTSTYILLGILQRSKKPIICSPP